MFDFKKKKAEPTVPEKEIARIEFKITPDKKIKVSYEQSNIDEFVGMLYKINRGMLEADILEIIGSNGDVELLAKISELLNVEKQLLEMPEKPLVRPTKAFSK